MRIVIALLLQLSLCEPISVESLDALRFRTSTSRSRTSVTFGLPAMPCDVAGPQSPRDLDSPGLKGTNEGAARAHALAGDAETLNLCNIHFHKNAEHKARDFSRPDKKGRGWQCEMTLSNRENQPFAAPGGGYTGSGFACGDLMTGDTIEVHWVYSSCLGGPGRTLQACLKDREGVTGGPCAGDKWKTAPIRVEAQVFQLVNGRQDGGLDFELFTTIKHQGTLHQVTLPGATAGRLQYLGSTTGAAYGSTIDEKGGDKDCSPYQVTWGVRRDCKKLDIHSLDKWCRDNIFAEHHAQQTRALVQDPRLLSSVAQTNLLQLQYQSTGR